MGPSLASKEFVALVAGLDLLRHLEVKIFD